MLIKPNGGKKKNELATKIVWEISDLLQAMIQVEKRAQRKNSFEKNQSNPCFIIIIIQFQSFLLQMYQKKTEKRYPMGIYLFIEK